MENRETIIRDYIEAYNNFDIARMVKHFDDRIAFKNISNGQVNLSLTGKQEFIEQAEKAKEYFSERKQTVVSISHDKDESEVAIDYYAVLAVDLPQGLKKGEALNLKGTSIFKFAGHKVVALTDLS